MESWTHPAEFGLRLPRCVREECHLARSHSRPLQLRSNKHWRDLKEKMNLECMRMCEREIFFWIKIKGICVAAAAADAAMRHTLVHNRCRRKPPRPRAAAAGQLARPRATDADADAAAARSPTWSPAIEAQLDAFGRRVAAWLRHPIAQVQPRNRQPAR
ncbi:unnamed protein product [Urochloa humidicola]